MKYNGKMLLDHGILYNTTRQDFNPGLNDYRLSFNNLPFPFSSSSSSSSMSPKNPPISLSSISSPLFRLPFPRSSLFRRYSSPPANASYKSPALLCGFPSPPSFGNISNS